MRRPRDLVVSSSSRSEAEKSLLVAKSLKRTELEETYAKLQEEYKQLADDYKLQLYALYVKMNATYSSCEDRTTKWFANAMNELRKMKDTLIKLQPFRLDHVDTDVETKMDVLLAKANGVTQEEPAKETSWGDDYKANQYYVTKSEEKNAVYKAYMEKATEDQLNDAYAKSQLLAQKSGCRLFSGEWV